MYATSELCNFQNIPPIQAVEQIWVQPGNLHDTMSGLNAAHTCVFLVPADLCFIMECGLSFHLSSL